MYSLLSLARELSDASHSNCCQRLISEWLPRIGRLVEGEHAEDGVIASWLMFYSQFTSHKQTLRAGEIHQSATENEEWACGYRGSQQQTFEQICSPTNFQLFFCFGFWRQFASKMLSSHLLKQSSSPLLIPFSISHPTQCWLWEGPRLIAPALPLH